MIIMIKHDQFTLLIKIFKLTSWAYLEIKEDDYNSQVMILGQFKTIKMVLLKETRLLKYGNGTDC